MKTAKIYRFFEIIPGALVWITILTGIILSLFKPLWAVYFIIIFDIYWLLRIMYLLVYMLYSWNKYRATLKIDWLKKLKNTHPNWQEYYHLIFFPVYNETKEIIEEAFESLKQTHYPLDTYIIVLTGEERGGKKEFLEKSQYIEKKYGDCFKKIFINMHPANLQDELPGKGSNLHHAGKEVKKLIDEWKLDYSKIIVSTFDIDTRPHKEYFGCLSYTYASQKDPTKASYQPIALYNNNVWQSNAIIRLVASSTTFWLLTDLARPERLYTFSSHSMSFKALVDVGFWDKTIVTEDSKIFLQCFVKYGGEYRVIPLFMPVYMNTVEVGKFWKSLNNQYKQMRRWAWGVEHFPWMMIHFFFDKNVQPIPFRKKIHHLWNLLEGTYSWATAPFIIYIVGHLPLWVAMTQEKNMTVFQNAPYILSYLMRASLIGIIAIAIMYSLMLPPKPKDAPVYQYITIALQWLLIPFTLVLFGSIPATDAQTRLMLGGKYRLGFWVTEKIPSKNKT